MIIYINGYVLIINLSTKASFNLLLLMNGKYSMSMLWIIKSLKYYFKLSKILNNTIAYQILSKMKLHTKLCSKSLLYFKLL